MLEQMYNSVLDTNCQLGKKNQVRLNFIKQNSTQHLHISDYDTHVFKNIQQKSNNIRGGGYAGFTGISMNRRSIWSSKHYRPSYTNSASHNRAHHKAFNMSHWSSYPAHYHQALCSKLKYSSKDNHWRNHCSSRISFPMIPSPISSGNQITINRSAQPNINNRGPFSLITSSFLLHVRVK